MSEGKITAEEMIKELEALGYEFTITKKPKENKVWKPKMGETYYFVNNDGHIIQGNWAGWEIDRIRYNMGNCYATEGQAKFALEKHKIMVQLKRFAEENNEPIDWNDFEQKKWIFCYTHYHKKIIASDNRYCQGYNFIYFSSRELCEQAIELIGEDRIKKYLFEIED